MKDIIKSWWRGIKIIFPFLFFGYIIFVFYGLNGLKSIFPIFLIGLLSFIFFGSPFIEWVERNLREENDKLKTENKELKEKLSEHGIYNFYK